MEFTILEIILLVISAVLAVIVVIYIINVRKTVSKAVRRIDKRYSAMLRECESDKRQLSTLYNELKKKSEHSVNKQDSSANITQFVDMEKLALGQQELKAQKQELSERNKQLWNMSVAIEKERQYIQSAKDEIERKSQKLEQDLHDLKIAQDELIRQGKMVTVGKLTQGLVDRILNPLNYINNFTKLSLGLLGDIAANIEDDKDNMDEENYEDTVDVLDMIKGNLQKVAEHGQCTTRTLKAMEEVIKDRLGGMSPIDLKSILVKNQEMAHQYHKDYISTYGIKVDFELPDENMPLDGNSELLSKTFMSIINNSFYAVIKKAERVKYSPEIRITANCGEGVYVIKFYDNGIGIEEKILDKVFDPFFTTKPTGEASGVGLYLSREIVQNHHGDISVKSEKDKFAEFTVTLKI